MATYRDAGCDILRFEDDPQTIEKALVQRFMPILYFAPQEHFYPVDLQSAIRASSLYSVDFQAQPPKANPEKPSGAINPEVDLPADKENYFTTVAGFINIPKVVPPNPPTKMPVPLLDKVREKYEDGTIGAELTIYATVCIAHDVPNAHLFRDVKPFSKEIAAALPEGLIINYYMYFPAYESVDLVSEGDWSGISLLFPRRPLRPEDLNDPVKLDPTNPGNLLPVLAAYYHKTADGAPPAPYFISANGGFRRWGDVQRAPNQTDGLPTHPIVYISHGRHNCYFQPISGPISLSEPWEPFISPDDIETGNSAPGPANNVLVGGEPDPEVMIPLEVIFPWMFFFHMCASGCQYPVSFDSSGVPSGYVDGNDTTAPDTNSWYQTVPAAAGAPYPQTEGAIAFMQVPLKLVYVDLLDPLMASLWRYTGAWGAATVKNYWVGDPKDVSNWGSFQGVRRPALAAWFMWNLFLDKIFGCGGKASVTPVP